jgi:hypothetical protein
MKRLALLLLATGCDSADRAPNAAVPEAPAPAGRAATPAEDADAAAAAAVLREYYARIGRGDYRGAWALRERQPGLAFERFAASFAPYADYRATVHLPSIPVAADGFVWVEVPVQLYGRRRDGRPFGSVGRVTMRRPATGGDWRLAL